MDTAYLINVEPEPERPITDWEGEAMNLLCSIPVEPRMANVKTLAADHDLSSGQIIKLCRWLVKHRNFAINVHARKWVTLDFDGAEVACQAASIWWERKQGKHYLAGATDGMETANN